MLTVLFLILIENFEKMLVKIFCSPETRLVSVKIGFRLKNLSAQPHFRAIIMQHMVKIGYESCGQGYVTNLICSAISRIPLWAWSCLVSKVACPFDLLWRKFFLSSSVRRSSPTIYIFRVLHLPLTLSTNFYKDPW